ncbi:MAG TPA: AMP-binding protein [Methylomirabilota bacterium]|nr:AMP-binding protein [Methylomirabilota bacterium]
MAALLAAAARAHAERPALRWDGGALTYAELDARACALARELDTRGVRPGDRVAIVIANRWQFVVAMLGALKAGATVAPLDPLLTSDERAAIEADLGPRLVLDDAPADEATWETAEAPGPALVLYTSGSTGRPKGAVLSHDALAFALRSWAEPVMALTATDVVLAALPLSHSYGLNGALLAPLLAGATVRLVERFTADGVATFLARGEATVFPGVATMFRRLLDLDGFRGGPALRLALSGAAPCPWEIAHEWRERTGVRILRGYGMTELFRPISYLAGDVDDRPDAIGRAVPGVDVTIVDESGRALEPGATGELLIRTPAALDGYLGPPSESTAAMRDGWFHTGDLASITVDGWVRITGRKRERILRGGYSIFPPEVESVLLGHPEVAEAAVIGLPHPELGEEIAAFVALRPGARASAEELTAYCRDRLAAFKYPRSVTFVAALPRSATGKVLKAALARVSAP